MARRPGVMAKNGHWYSEAGGKARYFGKVDDTSKAEATARLWKALAGDGSREPEAESRRPDALPLRHTTCDEAVSREAEARHRRPRSLGVSNPEQQPPTLTFKALAEAYLAWVEANRSEALHREAKRHLGRWCEVFGERPVGEIRGDDFEAFRGSLLAQGHARLYVRKHATTIKTMLNRGVKLRLLPGGFKPFEGIEGLRVEPKALLESDLPTSEEVRKLHAAAKPDFGAMLRVYYHTGARTHELIEARCGDYQPRAKALVMAKHKRSHTLRDYRPRSILLNDEAEAVIQARCRGRGHDGIIFPNRAGKPFTSCLLGDMFARLRDKAGVREHITIYSLRHLWISEMLMAGHDALIVAKMAGTSVKMVETVYGHFRTTSYVVAQAKLDAMRGR